MMSLAKRFREGAPADTGPVDGDLPVRVGHYRLCLEVSSGGMATVYLAHDERAGSAARFAAVKLIHPHLANDPVFAEMFVDEAEIASRIRHPNVCGVYDYDVSPKRAYIAMEYLVGESMAEIWRKIARARRSDPARTARLIAKALADACEGLHAAHELADADGEPLAVVHRDVSPGNIMVTLDGVTKVVDFGVAAAARKRHRTQTGMLKGQLAYIAPECLRGKRADRRSDVWAIGVIAWELVTGERLFRHPNDVDTLRAVTDAPIRSPSEVCEELPKELDDILMLALQRDPDDRYETARDLGRDFARFAGREEVVTTTDVGEWIATLFPGAKERHTQLLRLAAQMAPQRSDTSEMSTRAAKGASTGEHSRTNVYVRDEMAVEQTPARTSGAWIRWPALVGGVAAGLLVGLAAGGLAMRDGSGDRDPLPPPIVARAEPVLAPVAPRDRPEPPSELRIRPGAGVARGPYVLELVESSPNELLLRIGLDGPPVAEPLEDAPENELPPRPRIRARARELTR